MPMVRGSWPPSPTSGGAQGETGPRGPVFLAFLVEQRELCKSLLAHPRGDQGPFLCFGMWCVRLETAREHVITQVFVDTCCGLETA